MTIKELKDELYKYPDDTEIYCLNSDCDYGRGYFEIDGIFEDEIDENETWGTTYPKGKNKGDKIIFIDGIRNYHWWEDEEEQNSTDNKENK